MVVVVFEYQELQQVVELLDFDEQEVEVVSEELLLDSEELLLLASVSVIPPGQDTSVGCSPPVEVAAAVTAELKSIGHGVITHVLGVPMADLYR